MYAKVFLSFSLYKKFICKLISNYFDIETWSKEDIENAVIICKEKEGISLIDWINNTLLEMSKNY